MRKIMMALAFQFAMTTAASAACPADLAVYSIASDNDFSLSFSKLKDPKAWSALGVTLTTPTQRFTYEFTASNGYETFHLVPLDAKPLNGDDPSVYFFDDKLQPLPLPQASDPAPAYIFTPTLGPQLWYAGLEPRELLPTEMWKLSGCLE